MSKDYYKILETDKSASQDEIKKAFRKKAHEHHPDKGGNEEKFKEINEAYQVLGNEQKKAQYDQFGSNFNQAGGPGGFGGGYNSQGFNINLDDLGDMFGDFFGGSGQPGGQRSRRGNDIETAVNIEFKEAIFGTSKSINLTKNNTCDHCNGPGVEPGASVDTCKTCTGTGRVTKVQRTILGAMQVQTTCSDCGGDGKTISKKCTKCIGTGVLRAQTNLNVKIPAGIDNNQSIRLNGQGDAGLNNATPGDLYLLIRVLPDNNFTRQGDTVHSTYNISFSQAALGDKVEIETVDGPVKLKIPEGTQSGTKFKLRGKGVPHINKRSRGDHLVEAIVKTPSNISRSQKKLFKELAELK
ncbi:molecular chaperone DnaJ [Patescibacteria group bacterium]|nr:molecular chaperone DnaJ [Patescibacteria group bacterium]